MRAWLSVLLLILYAYVNAAVSGSNLAAGDESPGAKLPVQREYFGMHIHHTDSGTAWPAVKFGSWRLWDAGVGWPELEPTRDKWDFRRLGKYLAMAELTGTDVLLPLGRTPVWASARPDEKAPYGLGQSAEPRDINDWRNYVRVTAQRYKGRIRCYEIWNEPNDKGFYTGSPQKLLELQRVAYQILKEIDPGNVVVMPAAVHAYKWLDDYLGLGGGQYADVIGYHFYVPKDAPEALAREVEAVRSLMRKHGVGNKPLWNTETGWWIANTDGTPDDVGVSPSWIRLTPDEAAAYVARALIMGKWAGLDRFYWYAWDNKGLGLIEPRTQQLKPAAHAYGKVQSWLAGHVIRGCGQSGPVWLCSVQENSAQSVWLVWSVLGDMAWIPPTGWHVVLIETLDGHITAPIAPFHIRIGFQPIRVVLQRD